MAGGSLSQIAQIQKKQIWESFEQPEFIRWMIDVLQLLSLHDDEPYSVQFRQYQKNVDTFQNVVEKIIWKTIKLNQNTYHLIPAVVRSSLIW